MRRHLLGLIGLAFLLTGVWLLLTRGGDHGQWSMVASVCCRVGLVVGAIWLAFPQVVDLSQRIPAWLAATLGFGVLVLIVRPRAIVYVAPALAAIAVLQFFGWLFKPLPNRTRKRRQPRPDERPR